MPERFTPDAELAALVSVLAEQYHEIEPIGDDQDTKSDDPSWLVAFIVKPADPDVQERNRPAVPTATGWFELEQLVFWINEELGRERTVRLRPYANPPHLDGPLSLRFEIRGFRNGTEHEKGIGPDEVADFIRCIPAMIAKDLERQDEHEIEGLGRAYGAPDAASPND